MTSWFIFTRRTVDIRRSQVYIWVAIYVYIYICSMNTTILNDWAGHLCGVKSQPTILGGSLDHMVNIYIYIYTYHVQYHSIYIYRSNVIYLFISISTPEVPLNEHAKLA